MMRWFLVQLLVLVLSAVMPAWGRTAEQPEAGAAVRLHTEVHTYFVAGSEDAPAVWVHNTCAQELRDMNLKGWSKGKEAPHFEKHGKDMGFASGREYTQAARDLAKSEAGEVIKVGNNAYFKFDAQTESILIVTNRTIKTFYTADGGRWSFLRAVAEHRRVLRSQIPPAPHDVTWSAH